MKRTGVTVIAVLAASLLAACGGSESQPTGGSPTPSRSAVAASASTPEPISTLTRPPPPGVPRLDHIVWVLMENHGYSQIVGTPAAPYINSFLSSGALATNYFANDHPSLPNYAEPTSGQSFPNASSDCSPSSSCRSSATNIADRLEAAGLSWREYAESMPAPCTRNDSGNYLVRHDPWVYYTDISGARCTTDVLPFSRLAVDFASASTTPAFSFVTPNACHDMHDCSVRIGDAWLSQNLPTILNSPAFSQQHSVLVLTWDEGSGSSGNRVATILVGPDVRPGVRTGAHYTHYSLLHTLEEAFGLPSLTRNEGNAAAITDIWSPSTGTRQ